MKKLAFIALTLTAIYLVIGLAFDSLVGYYQPQNISTLIIQTQDSQKGWVDTVVTARDYNDELWVESGHWFRGWYHRLLEKPEVYIIRQGERRAYIAEPDSTPKAVEMMLRLMGKGQGMSYWITRTLLLWAPIKPVFLRPSQHTK